MKIKNIVIGIIMCCIAALGGYGVRYVLNQNKVDNNHTDTPSYNYTYEPTVEPTPVPLKENEQSYYLMETDGLCDECYYSETKPQPTVADEGFTYPDYQNYVIQDDGMVSVAWQDLVDNRRANENYQINDYFLAYTGKASVVANDDATTPHKLIPYDETIEEFLTADFGVHYVQLEGANENIDTINDTLRAISLSDSGSLQNGIYLNDDDYESLDSAKVKGCWDVYAHSDAYVIYNDDKLISIGVFVQNSDTNYSVRPFIKSININLETGQLLDFDYFVTPDMTLVNNFKAECKKQYPDLYFVYEMEDDEILSYFKGQKEFPPVVIVYDDHLEIGIDYHNINYIGFVTIDFSYDDYPQMNPFNK